MKLPTALLAAVGLAAAVSGASAAPTPTSFTYQGALADNGSPVDGPTAMQFKLWDAPSGGAQLGTTLTTTTEVSGGVFSESLDFGAAALAVNQAMWLEVIVEGQSLGRTPLNATPFALNTRGISVRDDGRVGIGVALPAASLHIQTPNRGNDIRFRDDNSTLIQLRAGLDQGNYINFSDLYQSGGRYLGALGFDATDGFVLTPANGRADLASTLIVQGGRVGVGTSNPTSNLHVIGDARITGTTVFGGNAFLGSTSQAEQDITFKSSSGEWQVGTNNQGNGTQGNQFYIYSNDSQYALTVQRGTNRVGINTRTPATTLDVNGAVTIRGGADLVEGFDALCESAHEPGTLLVIDPDNPGMLMCSEAAYDTRVAGVVSGANGVRPGIRLGQDGVMDGDIPVAMTGRVYVRASAENGAIKPGDLLTTSTIAGHAMKATDPARTNGAVIGKAMTTLDAGTGMVLVLVNLQ